jgi:putative transcription factor
MNFRVESPDFVQASSVGADPGLSNKPRGKLKRTPSVARAMPACEMCGREAPLRQAIVEGTRMALCPNCVKFGVEVAGHATEVTGRSRILQSLDAREARSKPKDIFAQSESEIVEDFGKRIRDARNRKGVTQEELARRLNERQSVLSRVEAGMQRPADDLARKLERELAITLYEKAPAAEAETRTAVKGTFTLGDLIKREEKGKR